jgi:hypothetical protein
MTERLMLEELESRRIRTIGWMLRTRPQTGDNQKSNTNSQQQKRTASTVVLVAAVTTSKEHD